jgi:hypothetical protein
MQAYKELKTIYVGNSDFGLIGENFRILEFCLLITTLKKMQNINFTFKGALHSFFSRKATLSIVVYVSLVLSLLDIRTTACTHA